MTWLRRLLWVVAPASVSRPQREAQAALASQEVVLEDARVRQDRADVVLERLHHRVYTENHIAQGLASLWQGEVHKT